MSTLPKAAKVSLTAAAVGALLAFLFWAFHGTFWAIARGVQASLVFKVILLLIVTASGCVLWSVLADRKADELNRQRFINDKETPSSAAFDARATRFRIAAIVLAVATVLSLIVLPFVGGWMRGAAVFTSVEDTEAAQPNYNWRLPWTVASKSASSRAGNVTGDFSVADTTYLPATDNFVTPVRARGMITGFDQVVVQNRDASTASMCRFAEQVPVGGGWFDKNLTRALSFVGGSMFADADDAWVYCDGETAKMVVPVQRYADTLVEGHPVPAGVVIFDGKTARHRSQVKAGELPGPVYPMSLAAAQRESTSASAGFMDKLFKRSGYETTEDIDGDANGGNPSELLLARTGGGFDFVTPLTPRGKSVSITAVATIAADQVSDGQLNALVVHKLKNAREGNQALSDRVKAAFPQLGWATGLRLVEILPTSATSWTGTLANDRAASQRVVINDDRTLCLTDLAGKQISCVDANNATQTPSAPVPGANNGAGAPAVKVGSDLSKLTDAQLAALQSQVSAEVSRRLTK